MAQRITPLTCAEHILLAGTRRGNAVVGVVSLFERERILFAPVTSSVQPRAVHGPSLTASKPFCPLSKSGHGMQQQCVHIAERYIWTWMQIRRACRVLDRQLLRSHL